VRSECASPVPCRLMASSLSASYVCVGMQQGETGTSADHERANSLVSACAHVCHQHSGWMAPFARRPCVRWLMRLWVLVPLCLFPPPYTHILTCVHLSVHVRRLRICNCVLYTYRCVSGGPVCDCYLYVNSSGEGHLCQPVRTQEEEKRREGFLAVDTGGQTDHNVYTCRIPPVCIYRWSLFRLPAMSGLSSPFSALSLTQVSSSSWCMTGCREG